MACFWNSSRKRPRRCSALAFARSTIMADKVCVRSRTEERLRGQERPRERGRERSSERSRERAVLRITQTSIHSSSPMRLPCAWAPDQQVRPIATFTSKCQSSCTREREVLARQTGAKATSLPQQQYKQQQTGISTMHALVLRFHPPPSFFFSSKICNKSCSCFLLPLGLGFLLFEQSHFLPPSLSLSHAHTHTHSLSLSLLAWLN